MALRTKSGPKHHIEPASGALPRHVGIIMDGNGRWAKSKGMPRSYGHREGLQTAKRIVEAASDAGLEYLSLYTFSTENWKRAADEVSFLMELLIGNLRKEYEFYRQKGIRVVHSGRIDQLPSKVQEQIQLVMNDTKDFNGLTVNLAINYGGRDEIIRSMQRYMQKQLEQGVKPEAILAALEELQESDISNNLDLPQLPDVDLIIRTGGEQRVSNFLLWSGAYAELLFSKKLWPDWTSDDLYSALSEFQTRNRRFGAVPGDQE